ncbi:MAG: lipocalin family protein [Steroidobacteraceae bacterium]
MGLTAETLNSMRYSSATLALSFLLTSCAVAAKVPVPTVSHIDMPRFMGDWYVIASIPTFLEKRAYNAVESYRLDPDGTVATTFVFRKGSFEGKEKTMRPRGRVRDATNAVWDMQFVWPIKAEYLIAYVNDDYTETIIARNARDYVWIMARTPVISASEYERLAGMVENLGYDRAKLRPVPQRWP